MISSSPSQHIVADGCSFPNGKCVTAWRGTYGSVAVFDSEAAAIHVHTVLGHWIMQWLDNEPLGDTR